MAIVTVEKNSYKVDSLSQWDLNQVLQIYGLSLAHIPEIHFSNDAMSRAIVRQATMDAAGVISVDIPNSLLQKPYTIKAFVCIYENDTFKTLCKIEIPVKARPQPSDYELTVSDEEVYSFNALENQVVNALVAMAEATEDLDSATKETERVNALVVPTAEAAANAVIATLRNAINDHTTDKNNPHGVTAEQIGAARVAVGSYVGTGTAGKDNPVLLTFDAPPKMVAVMPNTLVDIFNGTVFIKGQTENPNSGKIVSQNSSVYGLIVAWDGNSVAWYEKYSAVEPYPALQYNESGKTYFYGAIF